MSSIHRYIVNKIDWLREITDRIDAKPISRAQLPRILEPLDWEELNEIAEKHFGVHIELNLHGEWVALDGKTLRGTIKSGNKQAVLLAVTHETRRILAQAKMNGPKSSEIPAVRQLLKDSGLEKQKVSLDAHHCNPKTTTQINQAGGLYLTKKKDNQPKLRKQCETLAAEASLLGSDTTVEKAHGRITTRHAKVFSMKTKQLAKRWKNSAINTLVVMERNTYYVSKKKRTQETSYYITNQWVETTTPSIYRELASAIRNHWSVFSANWIRDVVFNEDNVKNKAGNQAQIMSSLRTLAMRLFRKDGAKNFQATIETFTDCVDKFKDMLKRVGFL